MTIGLRRARWYGSKVLVLGLPLAATGLAWFVPQVWQGALVTAAAVAASGCVAWGTFLSWGEYRPQPFLARAALAAHIYCGICLVAVPTFDAIGVLLPHDRRTDPAPRTETLYLLDGSVLSVDHSPEGSVTVKDDRGTLIETFRDPDVFRETYPQERRAVFSVVPFDRHRPWIRGRYGFAGRFYSLVHSPDEELWCYSVSERVLRGYDRRGKRPIGTLSPEGFSPDGAPPRSRFTGALCHSRFFSSIPLALTSGLYRPDFKDRRVETLFTPASGDELMGVATLQHPKGGPQDFLLVTRKILLVLESSGKEKVRAEIPFDPEKTWYAEFAGLEVAGRLLVRPVLAGFGDDGEGPTHDPIYEVAPDGSVVLKRKEPRPLGRWTVPLSPPQAVSARAFHASGGPGLAFGGKLFQKLSGERLYLDLFGKWRFSPGEFWGFLALGSIAAAAGALALARRDAVGSRGHPAGAALGRHAGPAVWTAAALVLGIPALLTLLCLDRRAVRVKCPSCGGKRPVGLDACPRCAAPFPAPAPVGTEIIEGLRPAALV